MPLVIAMQQLANRTASVPLMLLVIDISTERARGRDRRIDSSGTGYVYDQVLSAVHVPQEGKRPPTFLWMAFIYAGNDLLSHTLSRAVQSAQRGLTSVFGMGTGVSPAVRSPASLT